MSMSKKHYVDFVRMIRSQRHKVNFETDSDLAAGELQLTIRQVRHDQIDAFVNSLCDLFESDNPQFQAHKFIAACEIDTESTKKRA